MEERAGRRPPQCTDATSMGSSITAVAVASIAAPLSQQYFEASAVEQLKEIDELFHELEHLRTG